MLIIFLIICCVLFGLAYADYCMIDNVAHFGRCFGREADAAARAAAQREHQTAAVPHARDARAVPSLITRGEHRDERAPREDRHVGPPSRRLPAVLARRRAPLPSHRSVAHTVT